MSFTTIFDPLLQLFLLFWSWLVQGVSFLACSLEPSEGPSELPVSSSVVVFPTSTQNMVVFGNQMEVPVKNSGPPKGSKDHQSDERTKEGDTRTKKSHAQKRKVHELNIASGLNGVTVKEDEVDKASRETGSINTLCDSSALSDETAASISYPLSPESSTYSASVYSTPSTSFPLTPSPPLSPHPAIGASSPLLSSSGPLPFEIRIPSPTQTSFSNLPPDCAHHYGPNTLLAGLKIDLNIGELGKRRGFKGAPLFTPATAKKSSPFLSLPSAFSPRTSTPRTPSRPRSPLETVTNFIHTSKIKYKDVSQDLQDSFDQADPFATSSDSYFVPDVSFAVLPTANLENFGIYHCHGPEQLEGMATKTRTPSLKRKAAYEDLQTAASPTKDTTIGIKKVAMKTTVYNMSIYDVPGEKANANTKIRAPKKTRLKPEIPVSVQDIGDDLEIVLTPPSPTKPAFTLGDDIIGLADDPTADTTPLSSTEPSSTEPQDPIIPEPQAPLDDPEGSYFAPDPSSPVFVPISNLYDFKPYQDPTATRGSPSLKKKLGFSDLRKEASPPKAKQVPELGTNVYDLGVYGFDDHEIPSKKTRRRAVLAMIPRMDIVPEESPAADNPIISPVDDTPMDDPFAVDPEFLKRKSQSLRPLVLPLRIAKRKASIFVPPPSFTEPPCDPPAPDVLPASLPPTDLDPGAGGVDFTTPNDRRSKALDDIIALLDPAIFNCERRSDLSSKEEEVRGYATSDHWDKAAPIEVYAI